MLRALPAGNTTLTANSGEGFRKNGELPVNQGISALKAIAFYWPAQ